MTELHFDLSELDALGRQIAALPAAIKQEAFRRAMRRVSGTSRTQIARQIAQRTRLPVSIVKAKTSDGMARGGTEIETIVKSGWIPLEKLGATQTAKGVTTRLRGSYRSAFIAMMASGHRGVFVNTGKRNEMSGRNNGIGELFGANPAHDVTNHPSEYVRILTDIIEAHLMGRAMHELENLLRSKLKG